MRKNRLPEALIRTSCFPFAVLVLAPSLTFSQSASTERTLAIVGQPDSIKIVQLNGGSYINIEDLARVTHGSLSFNADRILLTLPNQNPSISAEQRSRQGFSKGFLQAGIELMSTIREWRITIVNSIQNNAPVAREWVAELQRRAGKNLALAATARSTDDDGRGYSLLAAEYRNMQMSSDRFLDKRQKLQYIDPRSVDNDPLDKQILACAQSLSSMAAGNQFHDEPQCIEAR